jgi:Zn-dependent peptidase ImmA (M78 family)
MIPDDELNKSGEISLQTILKIEHYYSVSHRALLYRLLKLGFLEEDLYEQYKKGISRVALQNGYPTSLYEPGNHNEIIGDYGMLANQLFSNEKISESHYLELMKVIGFNPLEQKDDMENGKG